MRLREITAITGLTGLFKMDVQRSNGMIVTSLSEGWTRFVPTRTHGFTPLENIAIYTTEDTIPLNEVLVKMRESLKKLPLPEASASQDAYREYMEKLIPDYDREKVYISDMKKLVRWYEILDKHGVIEAEIAALKEEAEEEKKAEGKPEEGAAAEKTPAKAAVKTAAGTKTAAAKAGGTKAGASRSAGAKGGSVPKAPAVSRSGKSRNKTD